MEQPLSSLHLPKYILQQLKASGYNDCRDFLNADQKTKQKFRDVENLLTTPPTKSALDVYQQECFLACIPTLIKPFDDVLDGGIPVGLITEIAGDADTRKTELCYRICTNVQLPIWCGGTGGEAVFIGTNKNFGSHRLKEVANNCCNKYCALKQKFAVTDDQFTPEKLLENIHYVSVAGVFELIAAIKHLARLFEQNKSIKVVIIDAISTPFKQTSLDDRKHLYAILSDLQKMAYQHGFGVVLTNELATKVNSEGIYLTAALGEAYYHRINIRIELKRVSRGVVRGYVRKSSCHKMASFDLCL